MTTATETTTTTAPYAYENEDGLQIGTEDTCWFCDKWHPTLRGDGGHLGVPGLTCDPCNDAHSAPPAPPAPHAYISIEGLRIEEDDTCEGCGHWKPDLLAFDSGAVLMCAHCAGVDMDDPINSRIANRKRQMAGMGFYPGR